MVQCQLQMPALSTTPRVASKQALLLLDGEDVVKLLKLSNKARKAIETAAKLCGPVVRSLQRGLNANQAHVVHVLAAHS